MNVADIMGMVSQIRIDLPTSTVGVDDRTATDALLNLTNVTEVGCYQEFYMMVDIPQHVTTGVDFVNFVGGMITCANAVIYEHRSLNNA